MHYYFEFADTIFKQPITLQFIFNYGMLLTLKSE